MVFVIAPGKFCQSYRKHNGNVASEQVKYTDTYHFIVKKHHDVSQEVLEKYWDGFSFSQLFSKQITSDLNIILRAFI